MKYLSVLLLLIICSCASYTISKDGLVEQLKNNQNITRTHNVASIGTGYDSNNLSGIKCYDKNGKEITITPDKNTTLAITNGVTGKVVVLYFDTVYLSNDSIVGLKSRIMGGKRSIAVDEISAIKVKTEN